MIIFTNGKPGEIRVYKAKRFTVRKVTGIARLLKNNIDRGMESLEN